MASATDSGTSAQGRHASVRVEPRQQGVGDAAQLAHLGGRQRVDHVRAHVRDMTWCGGHDLREPYPGQTRIGGPSVLGAREPLHEVALREASYDVGEPGQRGVRALRERRHPKRVVGGLGQHRKHEVLEVGEPRVAPQLGVQHAWEELGHRDQLDPRVELLVTKPRGVDELTLSRFT
jgi:hypothetical protein